MKAKPRTVLFDKLMIFTFCRINILIFARLSKLSHNFHSCRISAHSLFPPSLCVTFSRTKWMLNESLSREFCNFTHRWAEKLWEIWRARFPWNGKPKQKFSSLTNTCAQKGWREIFPLLHAAEEMWWGRKMSPTFHNERSTLTEKIAKWEIINWEWNFEASVLNVC